MHGKSTEEAIKAIDRDIQGAGKSIYRIRVIHGYNGGHVGGPEDGDCKKRAGMVDY